MHSIIVDELTDKEEKNQLQFDKKLLLLSAFSYLFKPIKVKKNTWYHFCLEPDN